MINLSDHLDKSITINSNVNFFEVEQGVIIKNHKQACLIKGKSSFELILFLFNHLDGTLSINEILPKNQNASQKLLNLLAKLIKLEFAKLSQENLTETDKQLIKSFSKLYGFVNAYTNYPLKLLKLFQLKRFVCLGSGLCLYNLINTLNEYGVKKLLVICNTHEQRMIQNKLGNLNIHYMLTDVNKPLDSNDINRIQTNNNCLFLLALEKMSDINFFLQKALLQNHLFSVVYPSTNNIHGEIFPRAINLYSNEIPSNLAQYNGRPSASAIAMVCNYIVSFALLNSAGLFKSKPVYKISVSQDTLKLDINV